MSNISHITRFVRMYGKHPTKREFAQFKKQNYGLPVRFSSVNYKAKQYMPWSYEMLTQPVEHES